MCVADPCREQHVALVGDSRADLGLQQLTTGETAVWLLSGATVRSSANLTVLPGGWRMRHAADTDGDGKDDLLFRYGAQGKNAVWFMNGTAVRGSADLPSLVAGWVMEGSGDFNGDRRDDVIWRVANGIDSTIWLMNGASVAATNLPQVANGWIIAGRR